MLFCQSCGYGRFAYTSNPEEFCIRCGKETTDVCLTCKTPLKDPDGVFCHACGSHLQQDKLSRNTHPISSNIQEIELHPGDNGTLHHQDMLILRSASGNTSILLNRACFEFLYYLAWLDIQDHNPLSVYQTMQESHKNQICHHHQMQGRFTAKWTTNDIRSKTHYIWLINEKLGFKLIERCGLIITISPECIITLFPF